MHTRVFFVSCILVAACSNDGGGANTSATTTITSAAQTTGTGDAKTTTAATTSAAATTSGSGGETASGTSSGTSAAETTDPTTGAATTAGVKLDLAASPDFGGDTGGDMCASECESDQAGQADGDWLLQIDGSTLYRINVADGSAVALCDKVGSSHSVTFTRDNRLLSSSGSMLRVIDPCTCTSVDIGAFPNGLGGINGIAPDEGNELFGFSAEAEALVRINTQTAEVTEVGPVGFSFGTHGAAWSEADQILYLLTKSTLFTVDTQTGTATEVGPLGVDFSTVGVELHPATGRLYGCTGDGFLYEIDRVTGQASAIAPLGSGDGCTNLGAPWTTSEVCLPIPG